MKLEPLDRALIAATQGGLPVDAHPYDTVGTRLGVSGAQVRERLASMLASGLIRRIGAVPNHYRLGFTANGMTVWDVDDAQVDTLGMKVGALPFVSHCYRRPRWMPDWPYNLFAMVHGRARGDVERHALEIHCLLAGAARSFDILYSTRILKKTGVRIAPGAE
jgi:siroheme decarboxylase